jgi:hypothetical protein
MSLNDPRLKLILEHAEHLFRERLAASLATARETLDLRARAAAKPMERDALMDARRRLMTSESIVLDALMATLRREMNRLVEPAVGDKTSLLRFESDSAWQGLTLVDDAQIDRDISVGRLAQRLAGAAEAELRELTGCMATLLQNSRDDVARHPLRADVPALALVDGLYAGIVDASSRATVLREYTDLFIKDVTAIYGAVLGDMKARGVRPATPAPVRTAERQATARAPSSPAIDAPTAEDLATAFMATPAHGQPSAGFGMPMLWRNGDSGSDGMAGFGAVPGARVPPPAPGVSIAWPPPATPGHPAWPGGPMTAGAGVAAGSSAPETACAALADEMTALVRRLNAQASASMFAGAVGGGGIGVGSHATGSFSIPASSAAPLVNLIHAHREALQRASSGPADHLVIDVVGGLFDQILVDSRVPPAMAREIARLQLPVLRVTLKDPGFFSSRQHPVRQFINRLASMACGFDSFEADSARGFLEQVRALVQQILDGDFERSDVYAGKLQELERFASEQVSAKLEQTSAAPSLLVSKEAELKAHQRYRAQLKAGLEPLELPDFLQGFLTDVWSQTLVTAHLRRNELGDAVARYRRVAADLVLSLKPKAAPSQRQQLVTLLPLLLRELNDGLRLIGWPADAKQRFLRQWLPAQAEALKGPAVSELEHNLLARSLQAALATPIPEPDIGAALRGHGGTEPGALGGAGWLEPTFTPEEARRIGWLSEEDLPPAIQIIDPTTANATQRAGLMASDSASTADPERQPAFAMTQPADFTDAATVPMSLGASVDPLAPIAASRGIPVTHPRPSFRREARISPLTWFSATPTTCCCRSAGRKCG